MTNNTMVGVNSTKENIETRAVCTNPTNDKFSTTARYAQHKAISSLSTISDNELFSLCQQYGNNAKMWKRKFEELLPEVVKRDLYKKRRFVTIYEFAAKVGGLSYNSVDEVLRVYKQLEDKPILRSLVVEFGWSKLRIVSGIATVDTDASWAEKVRVLPKSSLETFVRDLRRQEEKARIEAGIAGKCGTGVGVGGSVGVTSGGGAEIGGASGSGVRGGATDDSEMKIIASGLSTGASGLTDQQRLLDNKKLDCVRLPGEEIEPENLTGRPIFGSAENGWPIMSFKVDPETEFRLRKLKIQIEKERKIRMSFNQFFKIMIERAEEVRGSGKRQIDAQGGRLAEKKISTDGDEKSESATTKAIKADSVAEPANCTQKPAVTQKLENCTRQKISDLAAAQKPVTRYIPAQIKHEIEQKYHGHCGFPGCKKPFDVYHHVKRFALNKAHNPAMIVPLCKEHHDVAHGGWVGNEQDSADRPADWELEHEKKWFLPSRDVDEIWEGCKKTGQSGQFDK